MNKLWAYSSFILVGTFISSISQVLLKKAAQKTYPSKLREYANPFVVGAYIIFFAATFLSIMAYKVVPLSMGGVLESTGYLYVMIFGAVFLGERITRRKVLGVVVIITGIAIYSLLG